MDAWLVKKGGRGRLQVQGYYGPSSNLSQYFVLHTESGYLRFVPGPDCGWGTSVVIVPSFWSAGSYRQGMRCSASWEIHEDMVSLIVAAVSKALSFEAIVNIRPPAEGILIATVSARLEGNVKVDDRPGEAFKPVVLASMHNSIAVFDTTTAFVGSKLLPLLQGRWILPPEPKVTTASFGLIGGTSHWKTNAPTVTVEFDHGVQVAGWSTAQNDPNGDNVSIWAASVGLIRDWHYRIITTPVYPLNAMLNDDFATEL